MHLEIACVLYMAPNSIFCNALRKPGRFVYKTFIKLPVLQHNIILNGMKTTLLSLESSRFQLQAGRLKCQIIINCQ